METIVIANPKGGSGKTTLAVNLAGHYARAGRRTALLDLDRQQSALRWLARRPPVLPAIAAIAARDDEAALEAGGRFELAMIDTPAGLHGERLKAVLRHADRLLIPLVPSALDLDAGADFLELLAEAKRVRKGRCVPALVGMRVRERTLSARRLDDFVQASGLPVPARLHETQLYVRLAQEGLTLFDLPARRAGREPEAWRPLLDWLAAPRSE